MLFCELEKKTLWDAVVIGAGPAGSVAARELAKKNFSVLLLDKASFPRSKTCGGCLNFSALLTLKSMGLGNLVWKLGAQPLKKMILADKNLSAAFSLPLGAALSREVLDFALIQEAVQSGVHFLEKTSAQWIPSNAGFEIVQARQGEQCTAIRTKKIFSADGLGGTFLKNAEGFSPDIQKNSWIGISGMVPHFPDFYQPGTLYMARSPWGYAGLVMVEKEHLNIAASLAPKFLKDCAGPSEALEKILDAANFPKPLLSSISWQGTLPLNRRRKVACKNIFVLGDSAGYAEPFTGEGLAIAFASAAAAVKAAESQLHWETWHRQKIQPMQKRCLQLTSLLKAEKVSHGMIWLAAKFPQLAFSFARGMQGNILPKKIGKNFLHR